MPVVLGGVERAQALAAFGLGRDRRVVDERVQLMTVEPALGLGNRIQCAGFVGEIDLDVVFGASLPRTILGEGMTRAGDHAPAGGRETFDCRVANSAARPRQEQRAARLMLLRRRHANSGMVLAWGVTDSLAHGYSRVLVQGSPGRSRLNSIRSCRRKGRSCQNSIDNGTMR